MGPEGRELELELTGRTVRFRETESLRDAYGLRNPAGIVAGSVGAASACEFLRAKPHSHASLAGLRVGPATNCGGNIARERAQTDLLSLCTAAGQSQRIHTCGGNWALAAPQQQD